MGSSWTAEGMTVGVGGWRGNGQRRVRMEEGKEEEEGEEEEKQERRLSPPLVGRDMR